jgi:hypothetical protein
VVMGRTCNRGLNTTRDQGPPKRLRKSKHRSWTTSTWDSALDAVVAAPANHRVLFENDRVRVLEVNLAPDEEEPTHHHRWRSIFVLDQVSMTGARLHADAVDHDMGALAFADLLDPLEDVLCEVAA